MNIEIDKGLGAHSCFQCKSALKDADFVFCGIRIDAEQPAVCLDYVCPKCNIAGRWTIAFVQAEPSVGAALEHLKTIVRDPEDFKRTSKPSIRLKGNRLSGDLFNEF